MSLALFVTEKARFKIGTIYFWPYVYGCMDLLINLYTSNYFALKYKTLKIFDAFDCFGV